ncbi:MAG: PH domain-containing protein [Lachnospiraceae bacterium]|nr:PH domain-containing protein [Lachnospiraceae bacterium]
MDFLEKKRYKLTQINPSTIYASFSPLLLRGEEVLSAYQTYEDYVIYTNRRIITMVSQRTDEDTKTTFFTLPYSRILYFSIESIDIVEHNCILNLYFYDLGNIEYEFTGGHNVAKLSHIIGTNIFNFN